MNLFNKIDDLYTLIGYSNCNKPSFDEWKERSRFQKGSVYITWDEYLNNLKITNDKKEEKREDDLRINNPDNFLNDMYHIYVTDSEQMVKLFFKQMKFDDNSKKDLIKFNYNISPLDGDTLNGRTNSKTCKPIKNMFFNYIYDTPKYKNDSSTMLKVFQGAVVDYKYDTHLLVPSTAKVYNRRDYDTILAILRGAGLKISVFNPYTALSIFKEIQKLDNNIKKVVTPTMGWCSYLLGFLNSDLDEYVGIDVIDEVIEKGNLLHKLPIFKPKKVGIRKKRKDKKVKLFNCPSEKLDERHNFSKIYENHFDLSFCSPPYFDLEVYENGEGEQSINNFGNYREWLKGYWEETVKMLSEVMTDDGVMCFVISNYTNCHNNKTYKISEDMRDIASKYFDLESTDAVGWNSFFSINKVEKMTDGNIEDFHIFRKKRVK